METIRSVKLKPCITPNKPIRQVVVLHATPDDFRLQLERTHVDINFHWISARDQFTSAMSSLRPDAVFAIRQTEFGGDWHRQAALIPSVRWIHVGGSGYDHLLPLDSAGVCVSNGAGVLASAVADAAITGFLALNNNFPEYHAQKQSKLWRPIVSRSIANQTMLIVGLGAVGREVTKRAKALGMRVLAITHNPLQNQDAVDELFPLSSLYDLLPLVDVVTLHLRHCSQTTHVINEKALSKMKPSALLINTARGALVDEEALIASLDGGRLAGAYLDVFEREPLPLDSPLWTCSKLIITPHCADNIVGWAARMADLFSINITRWNCGQQLKNEVFYQSEST